MARYDREFLVPYLENICALYFAKRKLREKGSRVYDQIYDLKHEKLSFPEQPESVISPDYDYPYGLCTLAGWLMVIGILAGVVGIVGRFACVNLLNISGTTVQVWTWIAVIGIAVFVLSAAFYAYHEKMWDKAWDAVWDARVEDEKQLKLKWIEEKERIEIRHERRISEQNRKLTAIGHEIDEVQKLIDLAYDVNIIPTQYRNEYTAVYLYDWFRTSRFEDLDKALTMYVLEEIKSKLDTIIDNQMEMILNQRIMMANQQMAMEQAERHNAALMAKLDRIEATNEDRNMYLGMIEANTAANAYFSAANYLKH